MKLGFSTLALFMKTGKEVIETAKNHDFEIIELLAEDPFFDKDNSSYKDCGMDIRMHAATVDINIASLNRGIRRESINQMINCGKYAEKLGARTITIHPGKIGRIDSRIRKYALEKSIAGIGEIMDNTDVEVSVENMPNRKYFLANSVEELENIQAETGCYLTIDTGHANTCDNLEDMLKLKNISYAHIHDNDGINDQHLTLGEGTLDLNLLKKIEHGVIELNNFNNVIKSKNIIESLSC